MTPFPEVNEEFLTALRKQFPDQCPAVGTSMEEVNARAGEQRVIRFLQRVWDEQNDNILTREVL